GVHRSRCSDHGPPWLRRLSGPNLLHRSCLVDRAVGECQRKPIRVSDAEVARIPRLVLGLADDAGTKLADSVGQFIDRATNYLKVERNTNPLHCILIWSRLPAKE